MKRIALTVAALALTATGALAGGRATIEANEAIQSQRIETGRVAGALTKKEYNTLKAEQARIESLERSAGDHLSRKEYNRIHEAQLDAYKNINDDSSNGKVNYLRKWLWNHR